MIKILFLLTVFTAIFLFIRAMLNHPRRNLIGTLILLWLLVQGYLAHFGFYQSTVTIPPRFIFMILPPLVTIMILFGTRIGRSWMDFLDSSILTLLHAIRIPVEIVLLGLYYAGEVPELMTFEGRNFDILAGLSALPVYYWGYKRQKLSRFALIMWNLAGISLLLNVIFYGILSAPSPFQQFAFEQPNVAVLGFPLVWLPSFVVPLVLFSHLVLLRKLMGQT
jgi:hypothetical protein